MEYNIVFSVLFCIVLNNCMVW